MVFQIYISKLFVKYTIIMRNYSTTNILVTGLSKAPPPLPPPPPTHNSDIQLSHCLTHLCVGSCLLSVGAGGKNRNVTAFKHFLLVTKINLTSLIGSINVESVRKLWRFYSCAPSGSYDFRQHLRLHFPPPLAIIHSQNTYKISTLESYYLNLC